uniref:Uncharacterized protein n=1 Tax=Cacopsylla melanoneura TaxID=428564 RepID=A0A8D8ZC49_9HEMI
MNNVCTPHSSSFFLFSLPITPHFSPLKPQFFHFFLYHFFPYLAFFHFFLISHLLFFYLIFILSLSSSSAFSSSFPPTLFLKNSFFSSSCPPSPHLFSSCPSTLILKNSSFSSYSSFLLFHILSPLWQNLLSKSLLMLLVVLFFHSTSFCQLSSLLCIYQTLPSLSSPPPFPGFCFLYTLFHLPSPYPICVLYSVFLFIKEKYSKKYSKIASKIDK